MGEHLAQPLAVQLDPLSAQPHEPLGRRQELAHLRGRELLVAQRDSDREVEQRVHAESTRLLLADAHRHLGPRRAPRAPPVGDAHDQPGRFEGRDGAQEAVRLGGRPGHRLVDRARVDQLREPLGLLGRPLQRHQEMEQRLPIAARGGLLERPRQRAMPHLAAGARPRCVGGEEGEGVLLVPAVLGQVQAHLADGVP